MSLRIDDEEPAAEEEDEEGAAAGGGEEDLEGDGALDANRLGGEDWDPLNHVTD